MVAQWKWTRLVVFLPAPCSQNWPTPTVGHALTIPLILLHKDSTQYTIDFLLNGSELGEGRGQYKFYSSCNALRGLSCWAEQWPIAEKQINYIYGRK
jgi:hypothetical protein